MPEIDRSHYEALAAAARRAASYHLMQCSSGNLSCRIDQKHMLIKASRAWMCDLTSEQVSLCSIADGACLSGPRPSVEMGFHAGILRTRTDVNVVLHFQSRAGVTLACRRPEAVNFFVTPEIPCYIGPIAIVPFLDPGSRPLADAVTTAIKGHNLAVLKNHGMVTVGRSYDQAIERAVFFEMACDIILRGGPAVEPLPAEVVAKLTSSLTGAA